MRVHSLDGLRGVAAYIVVLGHFQLNTKFGVEIFPRGTGQVGVMLFFALSGYLMGALYMSRAFTLDNIKDFYRKRIARIVPLYIVIVAGSYLVNTNFDSPRVFDINNENLLEHLLFWRGEHVLWTIAVEVQFYLIFPLIWYAHSKLRDSTAAYLLVALAALILLGYPKVLPVLRYLHVFLIGLLVSCVHRTSRGYGSTLFILSLASFMIAMPGPRAMLLGTKSGLWFDPALMIIIPVLLAASLHSRLANQVLGNRFLTFLGKISYSVYLTHYLVLWLMRSQGLISSSFAGLAGFLVATTLISWISYNLIESPARKWITNYRTSGPKEKSDKLA